MAQDVRVKEKRGRPRADQARKSDGSPNHAGRPRKGQRLRKTGTK